MFKAAAAVALVAMLLPPDPSLRFENDGVRAGGALIQGRDMRVVDRVLVSGSAVEPLVAPVEIGVGEATLVLEPGVRAERVGGDVVLAVHKARWIRVEAGGTAHLVPNAAKLRPTEAGWSLGDGRTVVGRVLRASVQQDESQKDIESMKEAARKAEEAMKKGPPPPKPPHQDPPQVQPEPEPPAKKKARVRRVFGDDPTAGSEATDSTTLRRRPQLSPSGP